MFLNSNTKKIMAASAFAAAKSAIQGSQKYSFLFDYTLPGWVRKEQDEALETLTDILCPYLDSVFQLHPEQGFCGGSDKLMHLTFMRSEHEIRWSKTGEGRKYIKIGTAPSTGNDSFFVHILRKSFKQAFQVKLKVIGGHENALRMHSLLIANPHENQKNPKDPLLIKFAPITQYIYPEKKRTLPIVFAPIPESVTTVASEDVVEVAVVETTVSEQSVVKPNNTSDDDMLLLLAMVHDQANNKKGFALPVTAKEFANIRLKYLKQNPQSISVSPSDTKSFGAAVGRFTKKIQESGFLVRRKSDDAWFVTEKTAKELKITEFAIIDPSEIKPTNSAPAFSVPKKETPALPKESVVLFPSPAKVPAVLVLEPVLSEDAIDAKISELKTERSSYEEKISQLRKRSELITKEIEDLLAQKALWQERREKDSLQRELAELEKQAEQLRKRLESLSSATSISTQPPDSSVPVDEFELWKSEYNGSQD